MAQSDQTKVPGTIPYCQIAPEKCHFGVPAHAERRPAQRDPLCRRCWRGSPGLSGTPRRTPEGSGARYVGNPTPPPREGDDSFFRPGPVCTAATTTRAAHPIGQGQGRHRRQAPRASRWRARGARCRRSRAAFRPRDAPRRRWRRCTGRPHRPPACPKNPKWHA
eukprot:gene5881-biopygen2806